MSFLLRINRVGARPHRLARGLAMAACAAVAGVLLARLGAPGVDALPPPALGTALVEQTDARPVARWFGGGSERVRITVHGLIAAGTGAGAALLAIDGGPPRAYRAGQTLAPGVVLTSVARDGVQVEQDGVAEHIRMPVPPQSDIQGFIRHTATPPVSFTGMS